MNRQRILTGRRPSLRGQRGVALVVGLIVLVVVTLIVVNAFVLSSTNLQAVNNAQIRDEAIAAANHAVEQLIVTSFSGAGTTTVGVDLDKNGVDDYTVVILPVQCARAVQGGGAAPSETELPALATAGAWAVDWDIMANVNHVASGAQVSVRQGIRVQMTDSEKAAACP